MTTITTAQADQLHATVRDARGWDGHADECDALDPCADCKAKTAAVRAIRHAERVAAMRLSLPTLMVPTPRTQITARLAAAHA